MDPDTPQTLQPTRPVMRLAEWKRRVKGGDDPGEVIVLAPGAASEVKTIDEQARTVEIVISRSDADRYEDTIDQKGWDLAPYKKNPVVLWGHDYYSPPIGRALELRVESLKKGKAGIDQLVAIDEFMPADISPFASMVFRMLVGRWVKAASVGFMPMDWEYHDPEKDGLTGFHFSKQELWEHSIVPVPAHRDALTQAKAAGVDLGPLKEWCERALDTWHEEKGVYVPRSVVEAAYKAIDQKAHAVVGKTLLTTLGGVEIEGTVEETAADPEELISLPSLPELKASGIEGIRGAAALLAGGEICEDELEIFREAYEHYDETAPWLWAPSAWAKLSTALAALGEDATDQDRVVLLDGYGFEEEAQALRLGVQEEAAIKAAGILAGAGVRGVVIEIDAHGLMKSAPLVPEATPPASDPSELETLLAGLVGESDPEEGEEILAGLTAQDLKEVLAPVIEDHVRRRFASATGKWT